MKNKWLLIFIVIGALSLFGACSSSEGETTQEQAAETGTQDDAEPPDNEDLSTEINIGALKGPTALGLLHLMAQEELPYHYEIAAAPDELVGKIASGELDVACLPTNLAATLYQKTNGNVQLLGLNTLGVLYIMESGDQISDIQDLAGKTIYATGQGAVPEYALQYILEKNGLLNEVAIEYLSEHSELAARMLSGDVTLAMLPEPFVTNVMLKDEGFQIALDLNEEWHKVASESVLSMGAVIVRKNFADSNKEGLDVFLNQYRQSVEFVNANADEAANLSEQFDIMPAEVAVRAIPNCAIVFITGEEMKASIAPFFEILMESDPKSVGGELPDEAFYYIP